VLREAMQRRNQMGATLVVALIYSNKAFVTNVGDSRIYRWNPERDRGQITRLTRDHSLVQRLVDLGQLSDEQRYSHPDRNMVLRSIGDARMGYADNIKSVELRTGDWLLLCTDGLWEMVRDNRIRDILSKATTAQDACDKLIAEANSNGGEDNITAVAVRFS
jgi:PPM family protein phosphatase